VATYLVHELQQSV